MPASCRLGHIPAMTVNRGCHHSAQAMPSAAALKGAANKQVIQVRDGCGPHRWRGPHGRCHHF